MSIHNVRLDVRTHRAFLLLLLIALAAVVLPAQTRGDRYIVVLSDPPLAQHVSSEKELRTASLSAPQQSIEAAQASLRNLATQKGLIVTGSTQTLLNAIFVIAPKARAQELRALPGVVAVVKDPVYHMKLNKALGLINAPAAWSVLGGQQNAGAGMKIGIIDSGIDLNHPAFQDSSLKPPAGFPKCSASVDCGSFTNKKVIVARSYVSDYELADQPMYSQPDDLSPRDRVGHGTAVAMEAAGNTVSGPAGTITGVAPKAFLGNYKVFGSPGVNDGVFASTMLNAITDAMFDGMDVVVASLSVAATWAPEDRFCGSSGKDVCDPVGDAFLSAANLGLAIVVAAGNDGDLGLSLPTLTSINSPGTVGGVITVGATTNAHVLYSTVQMIGSDAPANLRPAYAQWGDGPKPGSPLTAPVQDVTALGNDGMACSPLPGGSLNGAIALIQVGTCGFVVKTNNAQVAGAFGVIVYRTDGSDFLFPMAGLRSASIPTVLIGNTDGAALKTYLASHQNAQATLDPTLKEITGPNIVADDVAYFSSQGPSIRDMLIKPELVAPGTGIYMATQTYDPNGDLYDPSGYIAAQGTSFAVPLVAGAIALVKQQKPNLSVQQLKSAVVNTAVNNLTDFDYNNNPVNPARVTAVGAGKLSVADAVQTNVVVNPATISFGVIQSALPAQQSFQVTNIGSGSLNLTLSVNQRDPDAKASVTVSPTSLTLSAGQTSTVTVRMQGAVPNPGAYEGAIVIQGGAKPLRLPYLYLKGDGIPFNLIPLRGTDFVAGAGDETEFDVKVVDQYGVPVPNIRVVFRPSNMIDVSGPTTTDDLGIVTAFGLAGTQPGEESFAADAAGMTVYFDGRVLPAPTINSPQNVKIGVSNAGNFQVGPGLAPGSYATIQGGGLAETTAVFSTPYLPLSLANVSVAFDVPSRSTSYPGRIHFVSPGQINVQIPWELQGLSSVLMKVAIGGVTSQVAQTNSAIIACLGNSNPDPNKCEYTVPLADTAPAFFEFAGLVRARDLNYQIIDTTNPAQRGQFIQLYMNGLGPVDNTPPTGEATPLSPLVHTLATPTVTIGEQTVPPGDINFSGLTPTAVGLYQVNVKVPTNVSPGTQTVKLTINGQTATTKLPVR